MGPRLAWLLAPVLAVGVQGAGITQQTDSGRRLFVEYGCWQCHGYEGQGSVAGPRVAPTLLPYAAFEQLVRRPADVMPAYSSSVLPDDLLREIFAYLGSVEAPPPLAEIPALQ